MFLLLLRGAVRLLLAAESAPVPGDPPAAAEHTATAGRRLRARPTVPERFLLLFLFLHRCRLRLSPDQLLAPDANRPGGGRLLGGLGGRLGPLGDVCLLGDLRCRGGGGGGGGEPPPASSEAPLTTSPAALPPALSPPLTPLRRPPRGGRHRADGFRRHLGGSDGSGFRLELHGSRLLCIGSGELGRLLRLSVSLEDRLYRPQLGSVGERLHWLLSLGFQSNFEHRGLGVLLELGPSGVDSEPAPSTWSPGVDWSADWLDGADTGSGGAESDRTDADGRPTRHWSLLSDSRLKDNAGDRRAHRSLRLADGTEAGGETSNPLSCTIRGAVD